MTKYQDLPKKNKGFLKVSNDCAQCGFLKPAEKEILFCLLSHIHPSNQWEMTYQALAEELSCSHSKVKRVISDLLKKTYITSQRTSNGNTYKLDGTKNDPFLPCRWCQKRPEGGAKNDPKVGSKMTSSYPTHPSTTPIRAAQYPSKTPLRPGEVLKKPPTGTADKNDDDERRTPDEAEVCRVEKYKKEIKEKLKSLNKVKMPT